MSLNVYLFFNGNCEEAMNFYKDCTGGNILSLQRFGDTPMPCEESQKSKVMHAVMDIQGSKVMLSDSHSKQHANIGDNFSLALDFKSEETINDCYAALSNGGKITMPLQETFWGAVFGMCTDKFGVNWMFNYDKPKSE